MQDLSLHILDLVDNSLRGRGDPHRRARGEDPRRTGCAVEITDNGRGMDRGDSGPGRLTHSSPPSRASAVGLGLALFAQAARESGGSLQVAEPPGQGTTVRAVFGLSHPDCKPLGDVAGTVGLLAEAHPAKWPSLIDYRIVKEEPSEAQTRRS